MDANEEVLPDSAPKAYRSILEPDPESPVPRAACGSAAGPPNKSKAAGMTHCPTDPSTAAGSVDPLPSAIPAPTGDKKEDPKPHEPPAADAGPVAVPASVLKVASALDGGTERVQDTEQAVKSDSEKVTPIVDCSTAPGLIGSETPPAQADCLKEPEPPQSKPLTPSRAPSKASGEMDHPVRVASITSVVPRCSGNPKDAEPAQPSAEADRQAVESDSKKNFWLRVASLATAVCGQASQPHQPQTVHSQG